MLRLCAMVVMGIALGYCLFFTRLEGRSIASHLGEVIHSPVVQQKMRLVGREGSRALRKGLAEAVPRNLPGLGAVLGEPAAGDATPPELPPPDILLDPSPAAPQPAAGGAKAPPQRPRHRAHSAQDRRALDALIDTAQRPRAPHG